MHTDPKLLTTCVDVVIRFKGHGSYNGETGALRALKRRAPGFNHEGYQHCFALLCAVYDRAIEAVQRHIVIRADKKSPYSESKDIDKEACLAELEKIAPGIDGQAKGHILSWVIYWHYLR